MLRAAIFDFDGTIADTIPALRRGVNLTMEHFGFPLHTNEDILRFINHGARDLICRAMPEHLQADKALLDRVFAQYQKDYGSTYLDTTCAYDGMIEAMTAIKETLGLTLAVLSNKQDPLVRVLCEQILPAGLCVCVRGVGADGLTKPNPTLTQVVLDALGARAEECVMIGDSDVDVAVAEKAGLHHIGVTWGYRSEEALRARGATRFAATPEQLVDAVAALGKEV